MRTFAFIVVMIVGIQAYESVYPTDCPPGKNCYEEAVKRSAEVEVMFDEKAEVPEQLRCDQCTLPPAGKVVFKRQERDSRNCTKLVDATCKDAKKLSSYGDATKATLTCRQDKLWEYEEPKAAANPPTNEKVVLMDSQDASKWCV